MEAKEIRDMLIRECSSLDEACKRIGITRVRLWQVIEEAKKGKASAKTLNKILNPFGYEAVIKIRRK